MGRAGADERDSNTTLKSCSSIGGMLSVSTVVSGLMLLYLGVSAWSIGSLWFPRTCEASAQDHECVGPMHLGEKIGREKAVTLAVFASRSRKTSLSTLRKTPEALLLLDEITCVANSPSDLLPLCPLRYVAFPPSGSSLQTALQAGHFHRKAGGVARNKVRDQG